MAHFSHHLGAALGSAAVCAVAGVKVFQSSVEDIACMVVLSFGSAFIADMDSGDSHQTHHSLNIASSLSPALIIGALSPYELGPSKMFLIAAGSFLVIRVLLREIIRHTTDPRGMFHSLPAAIAWSLIVFLAFKSSSDNSRVLFASSAALGYFVHLLCDAFIPQKTNSGEPFSSSPHSGHALKLYSTSLFANFICYGILFVAMFLCARDLGLLSAWIP